MCETKDLDPTKQVRFDEFWNNKVPLSHRPQALCNDRCETLHALMLDIMLKGKCVIILHMNYQHCALIIHL